MEVDTSKGIRLNQIRVLLYLDVQKNLLFDSI